MAAAGNIFGKKDVPDAAHAAVKAPGLFSSAATEVGPPKERQSNLFKLPETSEAPKPLWSQVRGESVFPKAESKAQSPFSDVFKTQQQGTLSEAKEKTTEGLEAKGVTPGPGYSIFGTAPSSSSFGGIFTKGPSSSLSSSTPTGLFTRPAAQAEWNKKQPSASTAGPSASPPRNLFSTSAPPESAPLGSGLFSAAPSRATGLFTRPKEKAPETEETREESAPPASPQPEQEALLTAQTSTEEIRAIRTVLCDGVPPQVLNKQVLTRHFSRFGNVVKILINPRKNQATVTFDDHRSAKKAKEKGREVSSQAPPIEIIHYLKRRRSSDSMMKQPAKPPQPSFSSAEVDEELAAMSGTDAFSYAAPVSVKSATSSRVIGERELRSLPLKKKQDRPKREVRAGLKTEKKKKRPTAVAVAEPEEIMAKPVNERELLEMMRRPAHSDQDRYDVLEARDKLMKSRGLHRKFEGTVLVGTCPDICPERERYSRAAKNQLRVYEKFEDGGVNHKAVVKEYSRSSADQDVPLPHELRPSSVLATAMAHLLANVIDRIEDDSGAGSVSVEEHYAAIEGGREPERSAAPENAGEWFEFVWSTTRGLRKDITQQQLANPTAVAIVEKCARLHIVCAERLVEEDSHNFAGKLNDENLTKCLQTLKHMYEDLGLEGVDSPCEPEFRAYEILMNLNDGDTLRGVQALERRVRETEEIRFALDVFTAINSDNYTRFFRLARRATLLQGCILLRYFYQVRQRAVKTIVRAFCPNLKTVTQYSLAKLTYLLGFEDVQECGQCLRMHGIESEVNSDTAYLDRSALYMPDEIPTPRRARNLVESKRTSTWSVVINGGPLGANPYLTYLPHASFDENGCLRREAVEAADQNAKTASESATVTPSSPEECERRRLAAERRRAIDDAAFDVAMEIVGEVVEEELEGAAEDGIRSVELERAAEDVAEDMLDEAAREGVASAAQAALREAKNEELQKRLHHESKMSAAEEVCESIAEEVVAEMALEVADIEWEAARKESKMRRVLEAAADVADEICDEVTAMQATLVAEAAVAEEKRRREEVVSLCAARRELKTQQKFFRAWRKFVRKQNAKARILNDFTPGPAPLSPAAQLVRLGGKGSPEPRALAKTLGLRTEVDTLFRAAAAEDSLFQRLILAPLDLADIVGSALPRGGRPDSDLWWKCILCLPDVEEGSEFCSMARMLRRKMSRPHSRSRSEPKLLSCYSTASGLVSGGQSLNVCVRLVDAESLDEIAGSDSKRRERLTGTSGVLFAHFEGCGGDGDDDAKTLRTLVESLPGNPLVPVTVLSTALEEEDVLDELHLKALSDEGLISGYEVALVAPDIFDPDVFLAISEAISGLAGRAPRPPTSGLAVRGLRDFVEDFLCSRVFSETYVNLADRLKKGIGHQAAGAILSLYDAALDHLEETVMNPTLSDVSWPVPEMPSSLEHLPSYWNDPSYLEMVARSLRLLRLPPVPAFEPEVASWEDQAGRVFDLFKVIQRSYAFNNVDHVMRIRRLLRKSHRSLSRRSPSAADSVSALALPWTDIVRVFIDYKLSLMPTVDEYSSDGSEIVVAYFSKQLGEFRPPKSWTEAVGSRPDLASATMAELLERSAVTEEDKENNRERTVVTDVVCRIEKELDESAFFDERLKSAISGAGTTATAPALLVETVEKRDDLELSRPYEPVIACLSPTLARLANSQSVWTKTMMATATSPSGTWSLDAFTKKRKAEEPDSAGGHKSRQSDVERLKSRIEEDLERSAMFEKRLREAMGQ